MKKKKSNATPRKSFRFSENDTLLLTVIQKEYKFKTKTDALRYALFFTASSKANVNSLRPF